MLRVREILLERYPDYSTKTNPEKSNFCATLLASKKAQATEPLPQSMNGSNGARRTANSLMIQREAIYVSGLKRAVTTWGLWYKPLVDTSTPSRATLRQASQEARETAVDVTDAPD